MTLKALAEAALQQCAERTLPRTLPENQTAHYTPENQDDRTLQDDDESEAMQIARRAISTAALTDEQRAARIDDARRDPAIARLWAMAWPEAVSANDGSMVPACTEQATPPPEPARDCRDCDHHRGRNNNAVRYCVNADGAAQHDGSLASAITDCTIAARCQAFRPQAP